MLRKTVLGLGGFLLAVGFILTVGGKPIPAIAPVLFGLVLISTIIFEPRYKRIRELPPTGLDWAQTGEIFEDSKTGTVVDVWFNRQTSERAYVKRD
jgi:hypothetical protein